MFEWRRFLFPILLVSPLLLLTQSESGNWWNGNAPGGAGRGSREGGAGQKTSHQDLSGGWQAFLPTGFEQRVELVAMGDDQYELRPTTLTFSGLYLHSGDDFSMVASTDGSPAGFDWKIRSRHLMTLVNQTSNVGANYEYAILFRSSDKKGR